jgi:hypothetical protein
MSDAATDRRDKSSAVWLAAVVENAIVPEFS